MRQLHFLVEGQTEEKIVKEIFVPYYGAKQIHVGSNLLTTKQAAGGRSAHKGGVTSWAKIRRDIELLLTSSHLIVTTLIDYYALPMDVPGMATRPSGSAYDRVTHVETVVAQTIGSPRFVPHIVLHETEAWVLAECDLLGELTGAESACADLGKAVSGFASPELINEGPETAPSKRIVSAAPRYRKTVDGPLIVSELGIDRIRGLCPHADQRLSAVEALLGA